MNFGIIVPSSRNAMKNTLLVGLPLSEHERLAPHLSPIAWQHGELLCEKGDVVAWVVFPESGLLSCVLPSAEFAHIETGITAYTGATDVAPALADTVAQCRTVGEIAGEGWRLPAPALREILAQTPEFQRRLLSHLERKIAELSQYALCNRLHATEERLARWLLQISDAVEATQFELAPTFIATLLGTRRSAGLVSLNALWRSGLVECEGERIIIPDRLYLQSCACACYTALSTNTRVVSCTSWSEHFDGTA